MKFWKMNGAGNDFVVLNNLEEHLPAELFPQIARILCERHMSIGADGMMVVDAPTEGAITKCVSTTPTEASARCAATAHAASAATDTKTASPERFRP